PPLILAAVTAAWYAAGAVRIAAHTPLTRFSGDRRAWTWLAGLVLLWVALIAVSGEFVWLAFLLAMLVWHMLPTRPAVAIDCGVAVAAVTAFAWHQGEILAGAVLGPAVGIASAAVMTEVYQRLRAQSEERRMLLDELVRTQEALAARERAAGRLAERERLARDIHDTVGQSLSSVILLLRAALAGTARSDAEEAHRTQLQTALDSTLAALGETRRLVRGLAPESIEKHGLRAALTDLAADNRSMGVRTTFTEHGPARALTTAAEVALLRAAQEGVANARSHAGAASVAITLTYQDDEASVDVVDDGTGFDADAAPPARADGSGYGLAAMRTRIAEAGGTVVVESEPGSGTALRATVPTTPHVPGRPADAAPPAQPAPAADTGTTADPWGDAR